MKNLIFLLVLFVGCIPKPKPEFYINGVGYYTRERCIKSHIEEKYGYHYGYNMLSGKFDFHYCNYTETVCEKTRIDTIKIIDKK